MIARSYAVAGAFVVVVAVTQALLLAGERAAHSDTKAAHAQRLQGIADLSARAASTALDAQKALQRTAAERDLKHTKDLTNAHTKNEALRAADRPGTGRLRIAATCPAPTGESGVPRTTPSAGVDLAPAVLPPEVRQAVWDLRAALILETEQLRFFQGDSQPDPGFAPQTQEP